MQERSISLVPQSGVKTNLLDKMVYGLKRLLIPTQLGINNFIINRKRKNMLKTYDVYNLTTKDEAKKEVAYKKFETAYIDYLEAIDKYVMDSIYKKVRTNRATDFEKKAMANYYKITTYKNNEYIEYKFRKQRFLLELDYVRELEKGDFTEKHEKLYAEKQTSIHRNLLKNYAIKLTDSTNLRAGAKLETYVNIFTCLQDYVDKIFPIILKYDTENRYKKIINKYEKYQKYTVGKLDEKAYLEKNLILLELSRTLFTHSLPLAIAQMCYEKLLDDTRLLLINSKNNAKKNKAYTMILAIIEDLNRIILSNKVYWDDKTERENNKEFWKNVKKAETKKEKEILIIKEEIRQIEKLTGKITRILPYYKNKLVEYGVMRNCRLGRASKNYTRKTDNTEKLTA